MFSRPVYSTSKPEPSSQQRRNPAACFHLAAGGRQCSADNLQQGAFAGAVPADNTDRFSAGDLEVDALQGPEGTNAVLGAFEQRSP